jgi:hypothetical protein
MPTSIAPTTVTAANSAPAAGGTGVASSIAVRLFRPSLSDLFFLFFIAWMFLSSPAGWERLLLDSDTALHLRIGQYVLATHSVPTRDLFAFSKPAEAWYAFEWLSETAFAFVFSLAGFKGLTLLAGMLIALCITILLKYTIAKGANGMIGLVVILLTATAASIHYFARPHLFTLLFLAITTWVLDFNRRRGGALIWVLVPLTILWANLHAGFFALFAILGLRVLGCVGEAWFWPEQRIERRREALQLIAVGAGCALASLVNPYGIHLHLHILETLDSAWIKDHVSEFKSPSFRREEMFDFMILLFAGMACIPSLVRKRSLVEPLWILFLGYCALVSVRHVTIFALVAAPVIAVELSDWWNGVAARFSKTSLLGILNDVAAQLTEKMPGTSVFIPLVILGLAVAPGLYWPTAFPEGGGVPIKLIEAHRDLLANGRVFTSDQIADYLIFRNAPRQKVFLDSRHNYYGEKIGDAYFSILEAGPRWRSLMDEYHLNVALVDADAPLAAVLQAAGGWRLVAGDDKFVLLERQKEPM